VSEEKKYAEVIVDVSARQVNKIFHYLIPSEISDLVVVGSKVSVPFGPRYVEGYVVGFTEISEVEKLKAIKKVIGKEPMLGPDLLELSRWIANKYYCSFIDSLNCIVPTFVQKTKVKLEAIIKLAKNPEEIKKDIVLLRKKGAFKQAEILELALRNPALSAKQIAVTAGTTLATVNSLIKKGLLTLEDRQVYRNPYAEGKFKPSFPLLPTVEQAKALEDLTYLQTRGKSAVALLHGVTGSGKTEIYLQLIQKVLEQDKQVIVLVPEISLTPQMIERFKARFGAQVAVLHSRLSEGERFDEWRKIKENKVNIVVGARSAIFAPFSNLGLVIIDEEHESTYKQEDNPKYHAREVAIKRAGLVGALVLLGTATPSIESYYKATQGEYKLITLKERVENRPLPTVIVKDLREELSEGHKSIFSRTLIEKIKDRLAKQEQIILFLNRRGFSTFVMCRECGLVLKCPACSIPLTYHANDNSLKCHYCDFNTKSPKICPKCSSRYIKFFGIGTQKIEEEFKNSFPSVHVVRMDVDTTGRKGSHERILDSFKQEEAQVLIGTQMIAKGLDFPNVTLVGVITSDTSLNLPDFRSAERTFQLITQVAGRAGRDIKPGEVVIQTYNPEHYSIMAASEQDYLGFYLQEIKLREQLLYPPFSSLIRLVISHPDEEIAINQANLLGVIYRNIIRHTQGVELLGPAPAPVEKLRNKYRWQIVLKGTEQNQLMLVLDNGFTEYNQIAPKLKATISIDVDPQSLL